MQYWKNGVHIVWPLVNQNDKIKFIIYELESTKEALLYGTCIVERGLDLPEN